MAPELPMALGMPGLFELFIVGFIGVIFTGLPIVLLIVFYSKLQNIQRDIQQIKDVQEAMRRERSTDNEQ